MKIIGTFLNGTRIEITPTASGRGFNWWVFPPYPGHSTSKHDWTMTVATAKIQAKEAAYHATEGKPGRWKWTEADE